MNLKTSLMMLAAGSLVPLLVFAAVAVVQQVENQRARNARSCRFRDERDRRQAAGIDHNASVTPELLEQAIVNATMRRRGEHEPRAA